MTDPREHWANVCADELVEALLREAESDGVVSYFTREAIIRAAGEIRGLRARLVELCPECRMQLVAAGFFEPEAEAEPGRGSPVRLCPVVD